MARNVSNNVNESKSQRREVGKEGGSLDHLWWCERQIKYEPPEGPLTNSKLFSKLWILDSMELGEVRMVTSKEEWKTGVFIGMSETRGCSKIHR